MSSERPKSVDGWHSVAFRPFRKSIGPTVEEWFFPNNETMSAFFDEHGERRLKVAVSAGIHDNWRLPS